MKKILKRILMFVVGVAVVTSPALLCSCANQDEEEPDISTYGLYVNISVSLDYEGDRIVSATAKNNFTLLPSVVQTVVELYYSYTFETSYTKMTLAAQNTVADLEQGETLTASASTGGEQRYWLARVQYKKDSADWAEKTTHTILLDAEGAVLGLKEKEVDNIVTLQYWMNALTVSMVDYVNWITPNGDSDTTYIISTMVDDRAQNGIFVNEHYDYSYTKTIPGGTTVRWVSTWQERVNESGNSHWKTFYVEADKIYLKIIEITKNHITGYVVIEAERVDVEEFKPEIIKSVRFPKSFFSYQDVTMEQVELLIQRAIDARKSR